VPCGPIYAIDQVFADAQVQHLGIAQDVPNAENRHIRLVGQPVTPSRLQQDGGAAAGVRRTAEEILAEFGFEAKEITKLRQAKVV
jgi:crotonobetainyl-CoA:carnitine CoA-transferase CaiB-like acyl-CoA transferase